MNAYMQTTVKNGTVNSVILFAKMELSPALFYFAAFCILTYPAITQFSTHLFADEGDGLQTMWNLWWVKKAVTELHQSPWHTNYMHWPYGISLLGHPLHPFNGFLTMFLLKCITLVQAYNLVVIFSFVVGGLTASLLARHLTGSYWGSIIAGFLFTFSNYHFAHAEGHLQMVSLEWIPLFVLLWFKLLSSPTIPAAAGAAIALFLVILCDYYFFFYCVLAGLIIFCWGVVRERGVAFLRQRTYAVPLGVFGLVSLLTSGVLAGSFLIANLGDPFLGAHPADEFSLDLFGLFIYGGHWRFAWLTEPYWSRLTGNIHESSVHLGLAVILVLVYVWRKRKVVQLREVELWFFLLLLFAVLALGPTLHVWGKRISWLHLPYAWLVAVFPPLRLSGVPVRMTIMTVLAAAIIAAAGFDFLFRGSYRSRLLAFVLLVLLCLEYLPRPMTTSRLSIPEYVNVLKKLPWDGGVLDMVSSPPSALFYQTVHEKPLAFGYVGRVPTSVDAKDRKVREAVNRLDFPSLWRDHRIRYLITADLADDLRSSPGVIWSNGQLWLFDLASESRSAFGRSAINQPLPDSAFKAQIRLASPASTLKGASQIRLLVKVRNLSDVPWPALGAADGSFQINLGDHWLDQKGRTVIHDDVRVSLPRDLRPKEEVELPLVVTAPQTPGGYILELDMVQEHVAWFREKGSETAIVVVNR